FSSRRRHTRFSRDWSSDVCSSDLSCAMNRRIVVAAAILGLVAALFALLLYQRRSDAPNTATAERGSIDVTIQTVGSVQTPDAARSEERRVGKGGEVGGSRCHEKQ